MMGLGVDLSVIRLNSSATFSTHAPATFYVATTGDDSTGTGAIGAPWLTIQKGLDNLLAGDTLYIRGGTYTAYSVKKLSGSPANRITVSNYPTETVVIDTSTVVTGWVSEGGNLYHSGNTALGASFNTSAYAMWKDTTILTRATTPSIENDVKMTNAGSGNWTFQIYSTTDPALSVYKIVGSGGTKTNTGIALSGSSFDLVGIDTIYNYNGITIGSTGVSTSNFTVTDCDVSYTASRGINLSQGPTYPMTRGTITNVISHHCRSSNTSVNEHGFKFSADVDLTTNGTYVTLDNCQSYSNGYHGFQCSEGWDGVTIKNCTAHDNGLGGTMHSKSDAADIRCALSSTPATRIGNTVYGNTTYNTRYGIYLGGSISNNVFYGNTCRNATVSGIYIDDFSTAPLGSSNIIRNNLIYDSPYGIIIDTATNTSIVDNNTIDNCSSAGIFVTTQNTDAEIKNNISISPTGASPFYFPYKAQQDIVTVPDSASYNRLQSSTSYSVEFLGTINNTPEPSEQNNSSVYILNKGQTDQTGYTLTLRGGNILDLRSTSSGFSILHTTTSSTITLGAQVHIVATWTSGQAWKIYIDGTEASYTQSDVLTTPGNDSPSLFKIGNNAASTGVLGISGSVSRVRIYRNVNLSAANVTTLFGGGTVAGVTGEYLFTDGSGLVLSDSSGNGNHGTISGPTWSGSTLVYGPKIAFSLTGCNYNAYYCPDASPFFYNGVAYSFADYKTASGQDANSVFSDFTAQFTNYAGNNFAIGAGATTLKDAGATIANVPNDYLLTTRPVGAAYSIGAYEA